MNREIIHYIPEAEQDELVFLAELMDDIDPGKADAFLMRYRSRRRKPDSVLLLTLLGFVVIAGVQRFYLNQFLMGFIYLLTGGLCLIGTIIDLINHKDLTMEYNEKVALNVLYEVQHF